MTAQEALDLLAAFYDIEVRKRHGKTEWDTNTVNALTSLATHITSPTPKFGIMCCGTCGNGKTTLLYAFQRVVNHLQSRRHFSFLDDEYSRFKAGIEIFRAKEVAQISRDQKRFRELMQRPMLAIDDMGTEAAEVYDYNNINTPVEDLISYRYNQQLFTFITTNLTSAQIKDKYKERIADRFNEMLHVIVFKDTSYRKKQRTGPVG